MRVFLSSTYTDLETHRQKVENSLAISGIPYNAMEHFGSTPRPPITTCLNAVRNSTVFVGVLGVRYGGSPPGRKLSFTEREFKCAKSIGLPVFMFLIDMRNAVVAPQIMGSESQEQQNRLKRFKEHILNNYAVTFFTTPDDLARLILASLIREFGVNS